MIENLLTIVILSRERQIFLKRQFEYWKNNNNINVIIIDQSVNKLIFELEIKHINYIHTNLDFQNRILLASELIKTKYVIFLPDDEFLIPSCLDNCINFLEENRNFVSCAGRSIEFEYINDTVLYNLIYENLVNFEIKKLDSLERIVELSNPYQFQPIHSVCVSKIWKDVALVFKNLAQMPPETFELIYGFIAAYHGNLKVIPELMNLRSKENEPINSIDWNQKYLIKDLLFYHNKTNLIKNLYNSISINNNTEFTNQIMHGVYSYVHFQEKNRFLRGLFRSSHTDRT